MNAIKDRKIDAFFWVGGVPTAAVTDLADTPGIKIKLIDHGEAVDAMNKKYGPLYVEDIIPVDLPGHGQPQQERHGLEHPRRERQDERPVAYDIVKTLFEKSDDLVAVHGEAKNIELKLQKAVARRFRSIRARRSTSRSRASSSTDGAGLMSPPERPAPAEPPSQPVVVDEQALRRAEAFIEAEEGATNRLTGWLGAAVAALLVAMSLFHLYAAVDIVPAQVLRPVHVGFVLVLSSCCSRSRGAFAIA